jgi:hypothetical protein
MHCRQAWQSKQCANFSVGGRVALRQARTLIMSINLVNVTFIIISCCSQLNKAHVKACQRKDRCSFDALQVSLAVRRLQRWRLGGGATGKHTLVDTLRSSTNFCLS